MSLENSLNEINKPLYEKLKAAGADISFDIDNTADTWYVQEKKSFKIGSPDGNNNYAAMAHELLHIQLTLKGFSGTIDIYKHFNENNSVFTPDFIAHLNNNLAHFKMIDEFIGMGYNVDDFLQDTPKTYFLEGMLFQTVKLVAQHNAKIADPCEQAREIVLLCASAKLFELYKIKDPNTVNGLHPDGVMDQLREINKELVDGLNTLFNEWNEAITTDNPQFYFRLNQLLHDLKIPNAVDCK